MLVADAGGGTGGGYCSMESIINGSCGMTVSVLYTPKIKKDSVINSISTLKENVTTNQEAAEALIQDINGVLSSTNSNRFSTGEVATSKITDMNGIYDDLTTLLGVLGNMDVGTIGNAIEKYNQLLVKLKKETRWKFAKEAVAAVNGKVVSSEKRYTSADITWTPPDWYDPHGDHIYADHYHNYQQIGGNYTGPDGNYYGEVQYVDYVYDFDVEVQIQPDKFNIFGLEEAIKSVGGTLPYNPALIVDYEE